MNIKIRNGIRVALLICISCQNETKNTDNVSDTVVAIKDTTQLPVNDITEKTIPFPENVEILLPMQYRKENKGYPVTVKGKDWYEIYKNPKTKNWMIGKANLKISYGFDECAGVDIMIIDSKQKNAVLFFTAFEGLSENPETVLENKPLIPGNSVNFKMNNKDYSLSAFGTDDEGNALSTDKLPEDSEGNIYLGAKNFKLSFSSDESKSYSIAEVEEMHDVNPKIIWAGDLNGDGLPDMILDLSEDYESRHLYFFLSDKNDKEKPLKKIGDAMVGFDC